MFITEVYGPYKYLPQFVYLNRKSLLTQELFFKPHY